VREAIGSYRENNDWLGHFLDECCELGEAYQEKSGDFYTAYRNFCNVTGDYVRNSADFYTAIEQAGNRTVQKSPRPVCSRNTADRKSHFKLKRDTSDTSYPKVSIGP
jgi:phage/plasmid-associated DNA primase